MLQVSNSFYRLPGGELEPGQDEAEGLKKSLRNLLSVDGADDFEVGEKVGMWCVIIV
jgi:cleavage and polyadenylation specificity factor subunit 5